MNIYWSNLYYKPVFNINYNLSFGKVFDIAFSIEDIRYFLVLKNKFLYNNIYFISVEDIESFCSDRIYFTKFSNITIDINNLYKISNYYKKELYNEEGEFKGIIDDILIDNENFKIKSFIIVESFWDQIINSKKIILAPEDIIFKENKFFI